MIEQQMIRLEQRIAQIETKQRREARMTDIDIAEMAQEIDLMAQWEGRIAQIEERCSTMHQRIIDHDERLDELTGLVSALQAQAVEGGDEPDLDDLSPEERVSLDELAERMGMGPVGDGRAHQRSYALQAAYYAGDVPGMGAWERVAQESRRLEDEAINRAIDQGIDHCKTIRRLQADLDALKAGDGVPRVSVVDVAAVFNVSICQLCQWWECSTCREPKLNCDLYDWSIGRRDGTRQVGAMPSRFELREDLR